MKVMEDSDDDNENSITDPHDEKLGDSNPYEEYFLNNIPSVVYQRIEKDDVEYLTHMIGLSASNPTNKSNQSFKNSNCVSFFDVLLLAASTGSYDCMLFLLSTNFSSNKDISDATSKYPGSSEINLNEKDGIFIDLSKKEISLLSKLKSGVYHRSCCEDLPSPLSLALQKYHLNIVQLICKLCPVHSLKVLSSPLPWEENEIWESGEEDPQPSTIFTLVNDEKNDLVLTLALTTLDEYLLSSENNKKSTSYNINNMDSSTSIHPKKLQSKDVCKLLVSIQSDGSSLLHWAAEAGTVSIVESLVIMEPKLLILQDDEGLTALHSACLMKRPKVVRVLLRHGSNPHTKDENRWSPFVYAIYSDSPDCVMALLNAGQDSGAYDRKGLAEIYFKSLGEVLSDRAAVDDRMGTVLQSLAIVPEFHTLLNEVVADNPDLLLSTGSLSFLARFPSLLNLKNKLVFAKGWLGEITSQSSILNAYPMLTNTLATVRISLPRESTWVSFVDVMNGRRGVHEEDRSYLINSAERSALTIEHKNRLLMRSSAIFQFSGAGESGIGRGVEREVFAAISRDLTEGYKSTSLLQDTGSGPHAGSGSGQTSKGSIDIQDESRKPPLFLLFSDQGEPTYVPRALPPNSNDTNLDHGRISKGHHRVKNERSREQEVGVEAMTEFGVFGQLVAHLVLRAISRAECSRGESNKAEDGGQDVLSFNITPVFWKMVLGEWETEQSDEDMLDEGGINDEEEDFVFQDLEDEQVVKDDEEELFKQSKNSKKRKKGLKQKRQGRKLSKKQKLMQLEKERKRATKALEGIADLDAMLYQNLKYLLSTEHAEELSLTFTATSETVKSPDGANLVVELEEGGENRAVTDDNKLTTVLQFRYVRLMVEHVTTGRMQLQADLVRAGLHHILPKSCVELFSAAEVGLLLTGSTDIDVDSWKAHTVISGNQEEGWNRRVVEWFWKLVYGLDKDKRALLLRFCSGASRLPAGGFASLNPSFTISIVKIPSRCKEDALPLPTAATCFNMLKLPAYSDESTLRKKVMTAVLLGSEGFAFS